MDISQALRDTENALRDFIASSLRQFLGQDWVNRCGVSAERIEKWKERKSIEQKKQETGVVDERLIYYADFYDLKTILKKYWSEVFSEVFGDWKTMEVFLNELEKLRDPDAHRRELLPHQKYLSLGISGEIRIRIVKYRSKKETMEDCFPRIESARDSLGNIWTPGSPFGSVITGMVLRPGDMIDYVVTARDPEDLPIEYGIYVKRGEKTHWQADGNFSVAIEEEHIGRYFTVSIYIRSSRPYHAHQTYDDDVDFKYSVLPSK